MRLRIESAIQIHEAAHYVIGEVRGLRATAIHVTPTCFVKWEDIRRSDLIKDDALTMIAAGEAANLKQLRLLGEVGAKAEAYARKGAEDDIALVRSALVGTTFAGSDRFYLRGLESAKAEVYDDRVWDAILQVAEAVKAAMSQGLEQLDLSGIRPILDTLRSVSTDTPDYAD